MWPWPGRRAGSVESGPGLCVRSLQTGCIAVAGSPSCTEPAACLPAVTAIGLPTQASRNWPIGGGLGNRKRSECGWAEAQTCLRSSPISRRACTGGPTSDGAASTMLPRSDGAADHCSIGAGEGATAAETLVACARSAAGRLNSNPDEPEPPFSKRLTSLKLSEDGQCERRQLIAQTATPRDCRRQRD